MSEKKQKIKRGTIELPVYDVNKQMEYISAICNDFNFDSTRLITYMIADWINTFQAVVLSKRLTANEAFFAYLSSVKRTHGNLQKLKKEVENESK